MWGVKNGEAGLASRRAERVADVARRNYESLARHREKNEESARGWSACVTWHPVLLTIPLVHAPCIAFIFILSIPSG